MTIPSSLRLLASATNEIGDLFTRLNKDLFYALGYDDLRLNVHKTGREIDIQGQHRFEPRQVVAECKAHAQKMGGAELNKFFGVLTRERKKEPTTAVSGYFVSLSGFTESCIEQEDGTGDDRIILIDHKTIIEELVRSRVIIPPAVAAERSGQCAALGKIIDHRMARLELLGHQHGYVWAVYYCYGNAETHFALIHADGAPLAECIASKIVNDDRSCGGKLHELDYLPPPNPAPDRKKAEMDALERYRQWLKEECGYIQLDGLPADSDLSSTKLKLERLFVPLKASVISANEHNNQKIEIEQGKVSPIGKILETAKNLAILASPGCGKSTLLKRIAIAYAFPERRSEVLDHLPDHDWLPLFLRCRELRDRAHRPVLELISDLCSHSGMSNDQIEIFTDYVHEKLRSGKCILLIDGLDEITDEGARSTFANHVRVFLSIFPDIQLLVTSREAGFRLVANVMASICQRVKIAPLDEHDVMDLCQRWHLEVVAESEKVKVEARELANTIWNNTRIRALSENPLLLTTLLVVKRWVGELPRNRATLYREAIRVLTRTWNVEGYAPLDEEETLAQLSYIACSMLEDGIQQIGHKALLKLLQEARKELEAELQFAKISPYDFVQRIEYRSSLLIQSGYGQFDGEIQPLYEFRHLTFQEYLAARGYVEEQFRGRDSGKSLADLLESHFEDEAWGETISLATVLAGRKAEDAIKRLVAVCDTNKRSNGARISLDTKPLDVLARCFTDEVQVTGPTLRSALLQIGRSLSPFDVSRTLMRGKYGSIFRDVCEEAFFDDSEGWDEYASSMSEILLYDRFGDNPAKLTEELALNLLCDLTADEPKQAINAALLTMYLAFNHRDEKNPKIVNIIKPLFQKLFESIEKLLLCNDNHLQLACSWALAWIGQGAYHDQLPNASTLERLFYIWRQEEVGEVARFAAWAIVSLNLASRGSIPKETWGDCDDWLLQQFSNDDHRLYPEAALVVAWYRQSPLSDSELVDKLEKLMKDKYKSVHDKIKYNFLAMLEGLGDEGKEAIHRIQQVNKGKKNKRQK